jgi:hypothetical protein
MISRIPWAQGVGRSNRPAPTKYFDGLRISLGGLTKHSTVVVAAGGLAKNPVDAPSAPSRTAVTRANPCSLPDGAGPDRIRPIYEWHVNTLHTYDRHTLAGGNIIGL